MTRFPLEEWSGRRVLLVAPHADDEVFGCGGTLRRLADVGAHVHVVVVGRGDGGVDGTVDDGPSRREAESVAACDILGTRPPRFLRIPSADIKADPAAAGAALAEAVAGGSAGDGDARAATVDLLLVPSPLERHPTHAACLLAALLSGVASESGRCWGWGVWDALPLAPDVAEVDISGVRKEKTRAVAAHRSQLEGRALGVGIAGRDMAQATFSRITGDEERSAVERLVDLTDLADACRGADVDAARERTAEWLEAWMARWVDALWGRGG